ncbi:MAG: glycosyltransferase family 9 protein [Deltaproteobacteria bacterium]|nr:glycosyltransferase family 9 protein [Deltaproteobacteria bacterium]
MLINKDCRHFRGDIPCKPHKEFGVHCEKCGYYDKIEFKILIIKLDAVGDVLRTTCILHGLKEKYPHSHITWLTRQESLPLFKNNDMADTVIDYSAQSFLQIQSEDYDLIINPDAAPKSARLAEVARGIKKIGFGFHKRGFVYPFNKEAQKWFEMGLFDDVKKANTLTYQQIILDMIGLTHSQHEIVLKLSDDEKKFAKGFANKKGIKENELKIGLNIGAGGRWEHKKWTIEGFSRLIGMIHKDLPKAKILLYGGTEERERSAYLMNKYHHIAIDTGCENSLREFISLLDICDILLTGDTMALHMAIALKKRVVALFGPTSSSEIDLYNRGIKIVPEMDCICCYLPRCNVRPSCMERITAEDALNAIRRLV